MTELCGLTLSQPLLDLGAGFHSELRPQPLHHPRLVRFDPDTARLLGLPASAHEDDAFVPLFSGNRLPAGCRPLALDYAGHQFGHFNPFLGDGRVVVLGSVDTPQGPLEISVKGAGRTPYARDLDGRAGLTECLHEFSACRRLTELGIPAARGLCVIAGDEQVDRGGFEPAAVLVRVAPSHIRFGTFENQYFRRDADALRRLADYLIAHHYRARVEQSPEAPHAALLRAMVEDSARLIARWQAAGFVHGMMNTDNQSAVGITLDLGASAFTETHDDGFVASPQDDKGRYAFGRQPLIGLWNCNVLARALSPLLPAAALRAAVSAYEPEYLRAYAALAGEHAPGGER